MEIVKVIDIERRGKGEVIMAEEKASKAIEGQLTEIKPETSEAAGVYYVFRIAGLKMSYFPKFAKGEDLTSKLMPLLNKWVKAEYTEQAKDTPKGPITYRNLVSIAPAEKPAGATPDIGQAPKLDMTKADWAEIRKEETRRSIACACIGNLLPLEADKAFGYADEWVRWVYQKGAVKPTAKALVDTATPPEEEMSQFEALGSAPDDAAPGVINSSQISIIEGIEKPQDLLDWAKEFYGMTPKQVMEPIPATKFGKLDSQALTKIAEAIALARGGNNGNG